MRSSCTTGEYLLYHFSYDLSILLFTLFFCLSDGEYLLSWGGKRVRWGVNEEFGMLWLAEWHRAGGGYSSRLNATCGIEVRFLCFCRARIDRFSIGSDGCPTVPTVSPTTFCRWCTVCVNCCANLCMT